MKIVSGNITTRIPFVAVDAAGDPLTGLTGFTAYRNRNGAGAVAMTAPDTVESDDTNMPGEYWLLVNEDTTLEEDVGEHTMTFYVSHAASGMIPARLAIVITALNGVVDSVSGRLPAALEDGFIKAATKKVGLTVLTPGGAGGQKYGGA
jgi:hypothetical protein